MTVRAGEARGAEVTGRSPAELPVPRAFFPGRGAGAAGLAVYLTAGDLAEPELRRVLALLNEYRVDCLELAVPFPDSATDGVEIRESADRALRRGYDLERTLELLPRLRAESPHTRLALLVDWSHSLRGRDLGACLREMRAAGVDGVLVHGLPPVLAEFYLSEAAAAGMPVITTCYLDVSSPEVLDAAARDSGAYLYLVSRYGRSGPGSGTARLRALLPGGAAAAGGAPPEPRPLPEAIARLRAAGSAPVAVGFGVSTAEDVARVAAAGADAAILGTAFVRALEEGRGRGDLEGAARAFLDTLIHHHPHEIGHSHAH